MALVTSAGDTIIANRMFGTTPGQAEPHWLQWGGGTTAEAKPQTVLVTPFNEARISGASTAVSSGTGNPTSTVDTHQIMGTIVAAAARTVNEVGVFDAQGTPTDGSAPATGGNMYMRGVHGQTILATNDSIAYTIKVTYN